MCRPPRGGADEQSCRRRDRVSCCGSATPAIERAWVEFIEIYGPLVQRLARRKGLQDADAADLVQEVFRAVAGAIDRWDPDPARRALPRLALPDRPQLLIDFLARRRRHPPGTGDTSMSQRLEEQPAPAEHDTALFDAEYRPSLFAWAAEQVRGEFSESTWQAFWLDRRRGPGAQEAAEALGITVGRRLRSKSRVMARLRRAIERVERRGSIQAIPGGSHASDDRCDPAGSTAARG